MSKIRPALKVKSSNTCLVLGIILNLSIRSSQARCLRARSVNKPPKVIPIMISEQKWRFACIVLKTSKTGSVLQSLLSS